MTHGIIIDAQRTLCMGVDIPGLDIPRGINRFDGNEKTYLNMLRSYAKNTRPLLESIGSAENLAGYAISVHGIKGSSRGICADTAGELAEKLEHAAKAGDIEYIHKHNDAFLDAVWKLITGIEDTLSGIDEKKQTAEKPNRETLMKLLAACETYDMDAMDEAIAEISGYEYEADGGLADWIIENVSLTNYKAVAKRLAAYRSGHDDEQGSR